MDTTNIAFLLILASCIGFPSIIILWHLRKTRHGRPKRIATGGLIIVSLAMVGLIMFGLCTPLSVPTPSATPTQTFTPIPTLSFSGQLIVGHREGIFALMRDTTTGEVKKQIITGEPDPLIISPDNRYLLYQSTAGTTLVDLSTYEETTLFSRRAHCLWWSPDSTRFAYTSQYNGLSIYNVNTRTSELIFQAPSATYGIIIEYGKLGCAGWIGENRLIFQRFSGPMPPSVTIPGRPELDVNTTTLAILGKNVELIDSPGRLFLKDASNDGSYILIEELKDASNDGADVVIQELELYIANSFADFTNINLRSLASLPTQDSIRFMPNSNEIIVEDNQSIYFIDPDTLEIKKSFVKPSDWQISNGVFGVWMGDPNDGIYISKDTNSHIIIGDLNTGLKTDLWDATQYDVRDLAWVP